MRTYDRVPIDVAIITRPAFISCMNVGYVIIATAMWTRRMHTHDCVPIDVIDDERKASERTRWRAEERSRRRSRGGGIGQRRTSNGSIRTHFVSMFITLRMFAN